VLKVQNLHLAARNLPNMLLNLCIFMFIFNVSSNFLLYVMFCYITFLFFFDI